MDYGGDWKESMAVRKFNILLTLVGWNLNNH